jgi:hypothetical protein
MSCIAAKSGNYAHLFKYQLSYIRNKNKLGN